MSFAVVVDIDENRDADTHGALDGGERSEEQIAAQTKVIIQAHSYDDLWHAFLKLAEVLKHHDAHQRPPPGTINLVGEDPDAVERILLEARQRSREIYVRPRAAVVADLPKSRPGTIYPDDADVAEIGGAIRPASP